MSEEPSQWPAATPSLQPDAGSFDLVFVYGTLRAGERNDIALAARSVGLDPPPCLGRCQMLGRMHDLGSYPGVVFQANGGAVLGEVYPLSAALERKLDEIESLYPLAVGGASDEYAKHRVDTPWGEALVYLLNPSYAEGRPVITGGDWVSYRLAQPQG